MSNISPVQTLLALVSLIPNNHIRYALLELGASITVLFGVRLQRPSSRLGHLEESVADTEKMTQQAKLCWPRVQVSLTEHEVGLLKVRRSISILRCTLLQIPGNPWTRERFKNYQQLYRDIYQCEKEVERIRVAVQPTVEAERRHKYTGDIRETEAIVTAVRDPIADMYKESGGSANFHYSASESYSV